MKIGVFLTPEELTEVHAMVDDAVMFDSSPAARTALNTLAEAVENLNRVPAAQKWTPDVKEYEAAFGPTAIETGPAFSKDIPPAPVWPDGVEPEFTTEEIEGMPWSSVLPYEQTDGPLPAKGGCEVEDGPEPAIQGTDPEAHFLREIERNGHPDARPAGTDPDGLRSMSMDELYIYIQNQDRVGDDCNASGQYREAATAYARRDRALTVWRERVGERGGHGNA